MGGAIRKKERRKKEKRKKSEKEKGERRREKKEKNGKRKKEERRKRKIRLKAPALKFRAGFLIFSDLPRFPLGFRCLAENCMQFFLFFLQKASNFEEILHIKYVDKGMKGGI